MLLYVQKKEKRDTSAFRVKPETCDSIEICVIRKESDCHVKETKEQKGEA